MVAWQEAPLVVISNRGPASFQWDGNGWHSSPSAGGLASMLTPLVREAGLTWVCCAAEPPAVEGHRAELDAVAQAASRDVRVVAVPVPASMYAGYYNGVSNEVLWMVQHRLFGSTGFEGVSALHQRAWSEAYLAANQRIAEVVRRSCPEARALLVQDYHLYPLPALLRAAHPGLPILHFTHIPFPSPWIWSLLPRSWPAAILRGMLGADVVGLQTGRDVHAFLEACEAILGLRIQLGVSRGEPAGDVELPAGRRVPVRSYPAAIDPPSLRREMQTPAVQAARERLTQYFGQRLIVRTDRLDPAKNQRAGFTAFGELLEHRPDLHGHLRFLAILSPSRTELAAYQAYGTAVCAEVERINERFGERCGGPPIVLHLENDRALALAALERSNVLLANSLADGMNLVPKEWATIAQRPGVAVISETAGVADEALNAAILVSPHDVTGTAHALSDALDMPRAERTRRLTLFRDRVAAWTSRDWLAAQLMDLEQHTGGTRPTGEAVPSVLPLG